MLDGVYMYVYIKFNIITLNVGENYQLQKFLESSRDDIDPRNVFQDLFMLPVRHENSHA